MTAMRFGVALPRIIVLCRPRAGPRRWGGFGTAADSFDRYARLAPKGDVVTIAEFEVQCRTELLKAVEVDS